MGTKNVVTDVTIVALDDALAKLPGNEAKLATGVIMALLGAVVDELPHSSEYVQPLLDHLHTLPTNQIIGGGMLWAGVGLFHKALRFVLVKMHREPAVSPLAKQVAPLVAAEVAPQVASAVSVEVKDQLATGGIRVQG